MFDVRDVQAYRFGHGGDVVGHGRRAPGNAFRGEGDSPCTVPALISSKPLNARAYPVPEFLKGGSTAFPMGAGFCV